MTAAILSIGNELLRGEIADTNAQWLAEQLSAVGVEVGCIETVGDEPPRLHAALEHLLATHDLVLATGGLGPTSDDNTAAVAAQVLGVELVSNEDALSAIRRRVQERGGELRNGHKKQALLPHGADMLPNGCGTAPGFSIRHNGTPAYFMPGVPSEMEAMFDQHVLPRVRTNGASNSYALVLHTFGRGESWIAEKLDGIEAATPDVTLRYRARSPEVDIRIETRAADYGAAREQAMSVAAVIRERLGECVYGEGEQTMPQLASKYVRSRGWRLAVAESCTGGLIAQQLTSIPASDYFVGGAVTYANTAKANLLGVSEDTLRGHGAVSAEVAAEMAEGARRAFDCDVAISVTGIAGPSGATAEKPIGLCHWAVAHPGGTVVEQQIFHGDRNSVQRAAATAALDLLRRTLNGGPTGGIPYARSSNRGLSGEELAGGG